MQRLATILVLATSVTVAGCSTPTVSKSFAYSADMPDGLVVFGFAPPSTDKTVRFVNVDPETCRVIHPAGADDHSYNYTELWGEAKATKYRLARFKPGTYVFFGISGRVGLTNRTSIASLGTIGFTVKPGDFLYVGNVQQVNGQPRFIGHNQAELATFLSGYPQITAQPRVVAPRVTTFAVGGQGRVAGCTLSGAG